MKFQFNEKNKKLLVESIFFNYHLQMKKIIKLHKYDNFKKIDSKFIIPKPDKKSLLMSKKFHGGVLMDMGPYISSIPRLFDLKTMLNKQIKIKKNKDGLIISIKFLINFKEGKYNGVFEFGGTYKNQIKISKKYLMRKNLNGLKRSLKKAGKKKVKKWLLAL